MLRTNSRFTDEILLLLLISKRSVRAFHSHHRNLRRRSRLFLRSERLKSNIKSNARPFRFSCFFYLAKAANPLAILNIKVTGTMQHHSLFSLSEDNVEREALSRRTSGAFTGTKDCIKIIFKSRARRERTARARTHTPANLAYH